MEVEGKPQEFCMGKIKCNLGEHSWSATLVVFRYRQSWPPQKLLLIIMGCAVSWSRVWTNELDEKWWSLNPHPANSVMLESSQKAINFFGGAVFIVGTSRDLQVSSALWRQEARQWDIHWWDVRSDVSTAEKDNSSGSEWLSNLFSTSARIVWQG